MDCYSLLAPESLGGDCYRVEAKAKPLLVQMLMLWEEPEALCCG